MNLLKFKFLDIFKFELKAVFEIFEIFFVMITESLVAIQTSVFQIRTTPLFTSNFFENVDVSIVKN